MKTAETVRIRPLQPEDAPRFVTLLEKTDREAEYLLFEPGERRTSEGKERVRICWWRDSPNSAILGAECLNPASPGAQPKLVGYLFASGGSAARNRHTMTIEGIAVLKRYQNRGIGRMLLEEAEKIAAEQGILRIGLGVMEPNLSARALYAKAGYIEEGRMDKAFRVNGDYLARIELVKFIAAENTADKNSAEDSCRSLKFHF